MKSNIIYLCYLLFGIFSTIIWKYCVDCR